MPEPGPVLNNYEAPAPMAAPLYESIDTSAIDKAPLYPVYSNLR